MKAGRGGKRLHFYVCEMPGEHCPPMGAPELVYTNYCNEQDQQHPRSLHSHHDLVELIYILHGEGLFEIGGTAYPVQGGDLVIYNSDVVHNEGLKNPPPPLYGIAVSGIRLEGLPPNAMIASETSPVLHVQEHAAELRTMFRLIYEQSSRQTASSAEICQSLLRALLRRIVELLDVPAPVFSAAKRLSKSGQLSREIQRYIDEHSLEDISVQSVAEAFSISPTYLSRLFKQATGMSLMQYVIHRRIGEAQTLLLVSDLSVTEIAARVGYDNLSHFVKMFTQNVGLSPRQYRKNGSAIPYHGRTRMAEKPSKRGKK